LQYKTYTDDQLREGLEACFGKGVLKLKQNLLHPKLGRLFEGKLCNERWGAYSLKFIGTVSNANAYRVQCHDPLEAPPMALITRVPAPLPPKPPKVEFVTETKVSSDGIIATKPVLGRDGEPIRKHPDSANPPPPGYFGGDPVPKPADPRGSAEPFGTDKRPPWFQRGDIAPKDKAEWLEWQKTRSYTGRGRTVHAPNPLDHSGVDFNARPNGSRVSSAEVSTLWRGTLKDL
jgi:hypothetical protein